jgi:hypothetical protein
MKGSLKIIVLIIVVVFLGAVGYLAYLGFVPGLSKLIGADKARDLGVVYSQKDFDSFLNKTNITHDELLGNPSPDQSIVFSGSKNLTTQFSEAEASARINYDKWAYMPISNVELRFNADGTFELSSNLVMGHLEGFIAAIGAGYTMADVNKGLGYLNVIKTDPPIYLKAKPVVSENQVNVEVISAQVGKVNIPIDKGTANNFLASLTEKVFARIPGFYVNSFKVENGKVVFDGTIPTKVQAQYSK